MPTRPRSPNGHGPPRRPGLPRAQPSSSAPRTPEPSRPGLFVAPEPEDWAPEPRGYEKLSLIADLAMGELSHAEIARREGFPEAFVTDFADQHRNEIAEVSAALAGQLAIETAGLWVTRKQNRLAEYQDQIEEIRNLMADLRDSGQRWSRSHRDMLRAYLDLFRQTADELGAYPQRSAPPARQGSTVHYVIETDDQEALR